MGEFLGLLTVDIAMCNQICDNCKGVKKYAKGLITE